MKFILARKIKDTKIPSSPNQPEKFLNVAHIETIQVMHSKVFACTSTGNEYEIDNAQAIEELKEILNY